MVNCWCKDLHIRGFRKSRKRHYSLSLLLLYQINVILTICGSWLSKNLEKSKKINKFNRLQIEVFFFPNLSPPRRMQFYKIALCPYMRPVFIWKGSLTRSVQCFYILGHLSVSIWSGTSSFYTLGDLIFLSGQEQANF